MWLFTPHWWHSWDKVKCVNKKGEAVVYLNNINAYLPIPTDIYVDFVESQKTRVSLRDTHYTHSYIYINTNLVSYK